jgi:hypothetical protein
MLSINLDLDVDFGEDINASDFWISLRRYMFFGKEVSMFVTFSYVDESSGHVIVLLFWVKLWEIHFEHNV